MDVPRLRAQDLRIEELRRLYEESRDTVQHLLSTQQELIETRARLDRELAVLRAIRDYSARVLRLRDEDAFWEATTEHLLSTFFLDGCVIAVVGPDSARLLSTCGCAWVEQRVERLSTLAALATSSGHALLERDALCAWAGDDRAPLRQIVATTFEDRCHARTHLVAGFTLQEQALRRTSIDAEDVPGFLVFAQQVAALYGNLTAQRIIEGNLQSLERANDALLESRHNLSEANRALEAMNHELALIADKRTREVAAHNDALLRAAQLKGELLAAMSHELRTPLNAILGLCEALAEDVYGPLTEAQARSIARIEGSGKRLLGIITDLLDVSKIEAGKMTLEVEVVPIDELCRASLELVRDEAGRRGLRVAYANDGAARTLRGDPRRLRQVLQNLLSNAVKFTNPGGSLGLEVSSTVPGRVLFAVWDTGIGVAEEDQAKLFQPFVQLDASLARRYPGAGLGLSLVARLAQLHGGAVRVASQPGRGSRFTVELPLDRPQHEWEPGSLRQPSSRWAPSSSQHAMRTVQPPSRRGEPLPANILLVDDASNVDHVGDYLRSLGCNVEVACDEASCVARAGELRPEVVLVDVPLDETSGLELLQHLRDAPGTRDAVILAVAALNAPSDQQRCLDAGADTCLAKPLRLRELRTRLERVCTGAAPSEMSATTSVARESRAKGGT